MNWSWRFSIRIIAITFLLYTFFRAGLSLYYIIILGIIFVLILLLRGKLYKKIDELLTKHFRFLSRLKPWIKKLIIILVFLLVYLALKELIYFILGLFGIDVQHALVESINLSSNGTG